MKVLMVLTSHDQLGNTGRKTGFWLEELAAPYYVFKDAGAQITLASPKGGRPPLDPKSNEPNFQTDVTRRFDPSRSRSGAPSNASNTLSERPFSAAAVWDIKSEPRGRWPRRRGIIVTTTPRARLGQHRNAGHSSTTKERSAP